MYEMWGGVGALLQLSALPSPGQLKISVELVRYAAANAPYALLAGWSVFAVRIYTFVKLSKHIFHSVRSKYVHRADSL